MESSDPDKGSPDSGSTNLDPLPERVQSVLGPFPRTLGDREVDRVRLFEPEGGKTTPSYPWIPSLRAMDLSKSEVDCVATLKYGQEATCVAVGGSFDSETPGLPSGVEDEADVIRTDGLLIAPWYWLGESWNTAKDTLSETVEADDSVNLLEEPFIRVLRAVARRRVVVAYPDFDRSGTEMSVPDSIDVEPIGAFSLGVQSPGGDQSEFDAAFHFETESAVDAEMARSLLASPETMRIDRFDTTQSGQLLYGSGTLTTASGTNTTATMTAETVVTESGGGVTDETETATPESDSGAPGE